eukprot:s1156_g10.t1
MANDMTIPKYWIRQTCRSTSRGADPSSAERKYIVLKRLSTTPLAHLAQSVIGFLNHVFTCYCVRSKRRVVPVSLTMVVNIFKC